MYWSGVDIKQRGAGGVGLLIKPEKMKNEQKEKYVNERLLIAEVKIEGNEIWSIIVAYIPNDNAKKEEKDEFSDILQNGILMGDMNGRAGSDNQEIKRYMGENGEETRNNNGARLIDIR